MLGQQMRSFIAVFGIAKSPPKHRRLTGKQTKKYYSRAMKTLLLPLFLFLFAIAVIAQQPDRWRGLILDEATPEQAIAVLGQPKSDKVEKNYLINYKWLKKDIWKDLRILHYENVEGFGDVKL